METGFGRIACILLVRVMNDHRRRPYGVRQATRQVGLALRVALRLRCT